MAWHDAQMVARALLSLAIGLCGPVFLCGRPAFMCVLLCESRRVTVCVSVMLDNAHTVSQLEKYVH